MRRSDAQKIDCVAHEEPSAILPSLWWVGRGRWGGLPALTKDGDCNIFLLKGKAFDVLVDCGCSGPVSGLEDNIRRAGSDPSRVREIWMTHSHYDHFAGADWWTRRHPRTVCRLSHIAADFLARKNYQLLGVFHPVPPADFKAPQRLRTFRDGDRLHCSPVSLTVEERPGHTPDAVCFRGVIDGVKALFTGDVAFGDQHGAKGRLGWIDGYWLSNIPAYRETLAQLAKRPPDLLLPGHGLPHAGASAKRSLANCLRRIEALVSSEHVAFMGPFWKQFPEKLPQRKTAKRGRPSR